ncbi:hypothetical protein AgCh_021259 [Apium graveolens]
MATSGEDIILAIKKTLRYGLFLGTYAATFVSVDELIAAVGGHHMQLLAIYGIVDNAERMLNLVHTAQSMLRAKDAITALPFTAGDVDYETGGSADFFGDGSGDSEDEAMDIGEK